MGINKDQVDGRLKEAGGKVQEVAGRVTGNHTQEAKGAVRDAQKESERETREDR